MPIRHASAQIVVGAISLHSLYVFPFYRSYLFSAFFPSSFFTTIEAVEIKDKRAAAAAGSISHCPLRAVVVVVHGRVVRL